MKSGNYKVNISQILTVLPNVYRCDLEKTEANMFFAVLAKMNMGRVNGSE